jgi:lipoprotein-anchoring transpeptidase ErfK/SrfK
MKALDMSFSRPTLMVAAATVLLLLAGCTPASPKAADQTHGASSAQPVASATPLPSVGTVATAAGPHIDVRTSPTGAVVSTFDNPQPSGAPLTFLVVSAQENWLKVQLPQRPNGSTGWISAASVSQRRLEYRLTVSTEKNTLSLYHDTTLVTTYAAATGTGGTPTPHGSFYLTELLAPTNTGYGPYAFGLSAFSDVLNSFGGGPGQIGLHGTNDAASIGKAASHGCIRLANADITTLAKLLPLGTPITIE